MDCITACPSLCHTEACEWQRGADILRSAPAPAHASFGVGRTVRGALAGSRTALGRPSLLHGTSQPGRRSAQVVHGGETGGRGLTARPLQPQPLQAGEVSTEDKGVGLLGGRGSSAFRGNNDRIMDISGPVQRPCGSINREGRKQPIREVVPGSRGGGLVEMRTPARKRTSRPHTKPALRWRWAPQQQTP